MLQLGILGSTRGTVMLSLIHSIQQKRLAAEIAIVLSNKENALILEHAQKNRIKNQFIQETNLNRIDYDQQLSDLFLEHQVDLILLLGYMRILSAEFVAQWPNKIINVHPSLLPAYAGYRDKEIHQAVIDAKARETGCTVHYVTAEVDAGPIIVQKKCIVLPNDNVDQVKARVQELESTALIEALKKINV